MNARSPSCSFQYGFTLVELMIAITLGLVLLSGMSQIYLSSKQGYTVQDNLGRLQESGRYALDTIANDLRLAGYWGGNSDISTIGGSVIPTTTCSTADSGWGKMIGQRVFGLSDAKSDPTGDYTDCLGSDYVRGDVLTVRHAASPVITSCDEKDTGGQLFIRAALFDGRVFPCSAFDDLSNSVTASTTHALAANAYYIGKAEPNPDCPKATPVTALAREYLQKSDGKPSHDNGELVRGIENLQVRYGLDTNGDLSVDNYVEAKTVTDWTQVIAVRVWLLARSECLEPGYTNNYTYQLGDQSINVNDGFRRQLYTTTVMLRNRG